MKHISSLIAFVDFSAALPLPEVAHRLSEKLFAKIKFVGAGEGIWDEVPALRLESDFMGLRVELGGRLEEGYTLEIGTPMYASGELSEEVVVGDLSEYLKAQLARISEVTLLEPRF